MLSVLVRLVLPSSTCSTISEFYRKFIKQLFIVVSLFVNKGSFKIDSDGLLVANLINLTNLGK